MKRSQRGFGLLLAMLLLVLGGMTAVVTHLNRRLSAYDRDWVTANALAEAKSALIGYAAGSAIDLSGALKDASRPGELPCPDLDNNGVGESSGCGDGPGTSGQNLRLGRLPWKDLGLPDLRDSSGERLWYAVSSNFKKRFRYNAPLNSDTPGTITLRDASGNILFNGAAAAGTGVVAVIIAPGAPLTRPASLTDSTPYRQDRGGSGSSQAINYLDLGKGEDNAQFTDGSGTDGFIAGPIFDSSGNLVSNDRLLWITAEELAPHLERRVAAEVAQCLQTYGKTTGARYPWPAADSLGTSGAVSYADTSGRRFGRVPDTSFVNTGKSAPGIKDHWTEECTIVSKVGWWPNWKELVFYAVAENHKPSPTPPASRCGVSGFSGSACLTLNGNADRQYVVLVAGRRLSGSGQLRSTDSQKNNVTNYLEGINALNSDAFADIGHGTGGNDILKGAP